MTEEVHAKLFERTFRTFTSTPISAASRRISVETHVPHERRGSGHGLVDGGRGRLGGSPKGVAFGFEAPRGLEHLCLGVGDLGRCALQKVGDALAPFADLFQEGRPLRLLLLQRDREKLGDRHLKGLDVFLFRDGGGRETPDGHSEEDQQDHGDKRAIHGSLLLSSSSPECGDDALIVVIAQTVARVRQVDNQ
jgi:hypothetical protein